MKETIAKIARDYLIEKECDGVMCGDTRLLDGIGERCKHTNLRSLHPLTRHQRILNALDASDLFEKEYVRMSGMLGNQLWRSFKITEVTSGDSSQG